MKYIAAGRYTNEAFELAGDANAYPEAGPPWRPERLFHAVLLFSQFKAVADYAREQGIDLDFPDDFPIEREEALVAQVTHRLDIAPFQETKTKATACHRTQFGEDHLFQKVPQEVIWASTRYEHFIQVQPPLSPVPSSIDDLFAGLPDP
jgi:mycothiol S-conjugate amidase